MSEASASAAGGSRAGRVAENLSSSKVFLWGLGLLLGFIALYLGVGAFKTWVKSIFGDAFDFLGKIIPAPASQQREQRTAADSLKGLVHEGDRALSDWTDIFTFEGQSGQLTDYAKQRLAQQQAK